MKKPFSQNSIRKISKIFFHKLLILLFTFTFSFPKCFSQIPINVPRVPHFPREMTGLRESIPSTGFKTFPDDPIQTKQYVLKNGLTVLLSENHDIPQVFGMVVVKAGGKNDPADATGLAHYLEHMLFKGTTTMGTINYEREKPFLDKINDLYEELGKTKDPEGRKKIQMQINEQSVKAGEFAIPNEIDKLLGEIGSTGTNAFTTEDFTAYHNTFPSNQAERWLEIYSHRFEQPVFRLFQSELETVYEEKNRGNDNAFNKLFETFLEKFYKKHPYGQQTVIGKTEHLKNPPLKKMYEYFNTYYVANNMALILAGDFNSEEILPVIEKKFGDWRMGKIPDFPEYKEDPFNGREFIKLKMTPVKMGVLGFRAPQNGHKDRAAVDICNRLLSNEKQTGLIDKLVIDGKFMGAYIYPLPYNDYGANILIFVPKIVGQKLGTVEKMVRNEIKKIQDGNIDEEIIKAVKFSIKNEIQKGWETNNERVMQLADCFTQNRSWGDYVKYEKEINSVTKEEIIRVAKQYYGDNFLCIYSKMGFPKKEKLDKPGFKPVIPKSEAFSSFRSEFSKIPSAAPVPKYVDFKKDVQRIDVSKGIEMNFVRNPFNSVFGMEIKFGVGKFNIPLLFYGPQYLNMLGTDSLSANELKEKFYKIGCDFSFSVTEESFSINIGGAEENLTGAIQLVNSFCAHVKPDDKKVKKLIDDMNADHKISRREPSFISDALQQYVLYGKNSEFLRELSTAELNKLKGKEMVGAFKTAQEYEITINYIGKKDPQSVKNIFLENFYPVVKNVRTPKIVIDRVARSQNTVVVCEKSNVLQSQINFNIEGKAFSVEEMPVIDAFNNYFGGDMSSLVFQEIREFRSLAYSTHATFDISPLRGKNALFSGYVGCQGDKTMDALLAMDSLILFMPLKEERMNSVKTALIEKSQSRRPSFRNLIETTQAWQEQGFSEDPNKIKNGLYPNLNFANLVEFYNRELKGKPITISIVGDKKRIDMKGLEKFGKVELVGEKDLFVN